MKTGGKGNFNPLPPSFNKPALQINSTKMSGKPLASSRHTFHCIDLWTWYTVQEG